MLTVPQATGEPSVTGVTGYLVLLEQRRHTAGESGNDFFFALEHRCQVKLNIANLDAVRGQFVLGRIKPFTRFQQRFARNTADAQAGAAERRFLLDHPDVQAQLRGADRGDITTRPRAG